MTNTVCIIGYDHEAINACILLASLDKQVNIFAKTDKVEQTLAHYKFDRQMIALWAMYLGEGKICLAQPNENTPLNLNIANYQNIWLFINSLDDAEQEIFVQKQTNAHSQIIISGTAYIGKIDAFANRLKTAWVYYLPFIFMKDGANFSSFFNTDLLMIGEKTPKSVSSSPLLLFLQKQAKNCEIDTIKTIEFARSSIMAMLATRLSFINEMARLADSEQINIKDIERIVGQDSRIGSAYLGAGWGFGGKSLPNELALLTQKYQQNSVSTSLLTAVQNINADQKELIFRKFWQYFDGFIEQKSVVIWGAGYRLGTSRITNSAIHELLKLLWSYQIKTYVYTKNTAFELQKQYGDEPLLTLIDSPYTHLGIVDGLFIINWSDLLPPDINELNKTALPIFDGKNILTDHQVSDFKGRYFGIGR